MSDPICAYCGKPIEGTDDPRTVNSVTCPFTKNQYHQDCWQNHRLDEVSCAYNKEGVDGLKKIEQADELDDVLGLS